VIFSDPVRPPASTKACLKPSIGRVGRDRNDRAPNDQIEEWANNLETPCYEHGDEADADGDFEGSVQYDRVFRRLLGRGHQTVLFVRCSEAT
jgi:hypothetical protein